MVLSMLDADDDGPRCAGESGSGEFLFGRWRRFDLQPFGRPEYRLRLPVLAFGNENNISHASSNSAAFADNHA